MRRDDRSDDLWKAVACIHGPSTHDIPAIAGALLELDARLQRIEAHLSPCPVPPGPGRYSWEHELDAGYVCRHCGHVSLRKPKTEEDPE